jgi:isoleucyl-tRNA synthetase
MAAPKIKGNSFSVSPGRGLGPFSWSLPRLKSALELADKKIVLGASLHSVLTRLQAQIDVFPIVDLAYDAEYPIQKPVVVSVPASGMRFRFDGPDQRLRLIEVIDFSLLDITYKGSDVVKSTASTDETRTSQASQTGPTFRHVYHKLFGPTFPGEYIPPRTASVSKAGTYVLSYPGVAFSFPLGDSTWSPKIDFVSLLSSSAASSAISMAIFSGTSWPEARKTLFVQSGLPSRVPASPTRTKEPLMDEVELVKIHGEGRVEMIRRYGPPFWITLSRTSPQDLVAELGPPGSIYRKNDRRISIHQIRSHSASRSRSAKRGDGTGSSIESDRSSSHATTDESGDDDENVAGDSSGVPSAECFYNYFHLGFDVFISYPTTSSPRSPTMPMKSPKQAVLNTSTSQSLSSLTATKLILHGNVPGSYPFNRHRRSRWTLEHVPLPQSPSPLTSEMSFQSTSKRLTEVWASSYRSKEDERRSQRGMVLNRGWGDSPGSSCELLGGWEESAEEPRKEKSTSDNQAGPGNTQIFGFPGLIFEVLENDAIGSLTVY